MSIINAQVRPRRDLAERGGVPQPGLRIRLPHLGVEGGHQVLPPPPSLLSAPLPAQEPWHGLSDDGGSRAQNIPGTNDRDRIQSYKF